MSFFSLLKSLRRLGGRNNGNRITSDSDRQDGAVIVPEGPRRRGTIRLTTRRSRLVLHSDLALGRASRPQDVAPINVPKTGEDPGISLASNSKVLLLGTGDSGKSTFLKQMLLFHGSVFSSSEIEDFRALVFKNIIEGMRLLLDVVNILDLPFEYREHVSLIEMTPLFLRDGEVFPPELLEPLQLLWDDREVQRAFKANKVPLPDNLEYFLSHLPRLFSPTYTPSPRDIMRLATRTLGVQTNTFLSFCLSAHDMTLIDVGGQKNERKKWVHCFGDVTAVLFFVNLSGYDRVCVEDHDVNEMMDAMAVWESICQSKYLQDTTIILLLNKIDLFEEKVKTVPIKTYFKDYTGPEDDAEAGKEYFKERLLRLAGPKRRDVFTYFLNAADPRFLRDVMSSIENRVSRSRQISQSG